MHHTIALPHTHGTFSSYVFAPGAWYSVKIIWDDYKAYIKLWQQGQAEPADYTYIWQNANFNVESKVFLAPTTTGFGYKAEFYADNTVKSLFQTMGYSLWVSQDMVIDRNVDTFRNTLTLRLNNIDMAHYGSTDINAKVNLTLTNGMVIESGISAYSMQDMVEIIDSQLDSLSTEQIQAVQTMLSGYDLGWNIPNLTVWTPEN